MIRVILSGGLGNQLFQYATGRAIAEAHGVELVLDTISGFKDDKVYNRSYELDVFPGPKGCRKVDVPSKKVWWWLRIRQRKRIPLLARFWKIVDEKLVKRDFDSVSWSSGEHLLVGFWQDETYFEGIRETLRKELALGDSKPPPQNAVAIHVRRVQYTRGVGEAYFQKSLEYVRKNIENPKFFLFTDDLEWGIEFSDQQADVTLASLPESGPIDDFSALNQFRHLIISNSTFSWWAAWLGEGSDSFIVSPDPAEWSNSHTPPERWIKHTL